MRLMFAVAALMVGVPAMGSTPTAMSQGLSNAKLACRKASDLKNAAAPGKPVLFSDAAGKTAIVVTGIWRPSHMKGRRATMLCLYDRGTKIAEVQEAPGWISK